jgi:hypothetical protein
MPVALALTTAKGARRKKKTNGNAKEDAKKPRETAELL